jgi:acyl carrier protein
MMSTRETVRERIKKILQQRHDEEPFADDESLVLSGRLDSLSVVELVAVLEEGWGLDFADIPFDQNLFDTVDSIVALLEESQRG